MLWAQNEYWQSWLQRISKTLRPDGSTQMSCPSSFSHFSWDKSVFLFCVRIFWWCGPAFQQNSEFSPSWVKVDRVVTSLNFLKDNITFDKKSICSNILNFFFCFYNFLGLLMTFWGSRIISNQCVSFKILPRFSSFNFF